MLVLLAGAYWLGQRAAPAPAASNAAPAAERKPLYYRNPMGLADTSPVPKQDSMGMDYVPVYADEAAAAPGAGSVTLEAARVQQLGVRAEAVAERSLAPELRASGRIEADERSLHAVAPRFDGWIERLHANASGQPVAKGQVLFEVYSPELVSAQREYAAAAQGEATAGDAENRAVMHRLAEAALQRLRNWEIPPAQIEALARGGDARPTLAIRAPVSGIVTEKRAVQGMRFAAGDTLFTLADLSRVWVLADVAEQDAAALKPGVRARVRTAAEPGREIEGTVAYVYPNLNGETRTVSARIELPNPGGRLKPGMYAEVLLGAGKTTPMPAVPLSAVIDGGRGQHVIVRIETARGFRFTPRDVKLGRRDAEHVEVLEGVQEGETVVTSANFLIDAESNLRAALDGLAPPPPAPARAEPTRSDRAEPTRSDRAEPTPPTRAEPTPPVRAEPVEAPGRARDPSAGKDSGALRQAQGEREKEAQGERKKEAHGEWEKEAQGEREKEAHGERNGGAHGEQGKVIIANGVLNGIDAKDNSANISHEAIGRLHWPAMTMDFAVSNGAVLKAAVPGSRIRFELVERGKGDWVVTRIEPLAGKEP